MKKKKFSKYLDKRLDLSPNFKLGLSLGLIVMLIISFLSLPEVSSYSGVSISNLGIIRVVTPRTCPGNVLVTVQYSYFIHDDQYQRGNKSQSIELWEWDPSILDPDEKLNESTDTIPKPLLLSMMALKRRCISLYFSSNFLNPKEKQ